MDTSGPALRPTTEDEALRQLALLANRLSDAGQLRVESLVGDDQVVQAVGNFAGDARPLQRHPLAVKSPPLIFARTFKGPKHQQRPSEPWINPLANLSLAILQKR